jgi:hypothetical protein
VQAFVKSVGQNTGNIPVAGGSGGSVAALMKSMAAARGWTGSQWNALYDVEQREAGFNLNAKNPGSGAYGLAQFINGPSEYAQYGGSVGSASGQITALLNYVAQRYGNPAAAWAHESEFGWYNKGGMIGSGKNFAMGGTITEPVNGIGMNSGLPYRFGEGGRVENVAYNSNGNGNPDTITHSQGATIIAALSQLVQVMQQSPQQTAAAISQNRQYRVGVPR